MTRSETKYKRATALLGTFLVVESSATKSALPLLGKSVSTAFAEAARLEAIFSKFQKNSTLTKLSGAPIGSKLVVEKEFGELLSLALEVWEESRGSFNPFFPSQQTLDSEPFVFGKNAEGAYCIEKKAAISLDLNGIAKGYIVDKVAERLATLLPGESGTVNAGGEIRFFGAAENKTVQLRLGSREAPLLRSLRVTKKSVASSAPGFDETSTQYAAQKEQSVSVVSEDCCIADSLTKVALFAEPSVVEACAKYFAAQIFIFNPNGELTESYGRP